LTKKLIKKKKFGVKLFGHFKPQFITYIFFSLKTDQKICKNISLKFLEFFFSSFFVEKMASNVLAQKIIMPKKTFSEKFGVKICSHTIALISKK